MTSPRFGAAPNRLASEKSPYLLQHAHNPVDWRPWGPEAFAEAKRTDRPLFVSIGYSTCHWCHVMERESFEDPAVAEELNRYFVPVKVDREERPDIDHLYMEYVMAVNGHGGWPMSVFVTPEGRPFYGGTYFPPQDRYGMPGFRTLIVSLAEAWRTRRQEIETSAASAADYLRTRSEQTVGVEALGEETFRDFIEHQSGAYDADRGGFGGAPKFPRPHVLSALLVSARRTGSRQAVEMALGTLEAMRRGGMRDQLGGGYHRYSTDARWFLPHFEIMLYDQALLVHAYLDAYQTARRPEDAEAARGILRYVDSRLTGPHGAYLSAEDADSLPSPSASHKSEGAYYIWSTEEVRRLLGQDAELFISRYGLLERGNVDNDPHGEFTGRNVLYQALTLEQVAERSGLGAGEVERRSEASRLRLLQERAKRPAPHLDDKVLADWNGLMIGASARAASVLGEPAYLERARSAARFVSERMVGPDGAPLHRYRDGESAIRATLDDLAFLADGYLWLYEAGQEPEWLERAIGLAERIERDHRDPQSGACYLTAADAEPLVARPLQTYDGAVPAGGSVAADVFLRLGSLTGRSEWTAAGERILASLSARLAAEPSAHPRLLMALDRSMGPALEIVIAADEPDDPTVSAFLREIHLPFVPNKTIMVHTSGKAGRTLHRLSVAVAGKTPVAGRPCVYLCAGGTCSEPLTEPAALARALRDLADRR
ncbi:MAG: hypothetical protein MOGMAGMI_00500 [Candidatus Omnitrophica bacterium]|nr:hypothetical protein [Candidatus Omnitrophota bacterium]